MRTPLARNRNGAFAPGAPSDVAAAEAGDASGDYGSEVDGIAAAGVVSAGHAFGASSELRASFRLREGRTALGDAYFTSPLKLTKPFPVDGPSAGAAVTVMDVSPGLMDGDEYRLDWEIGAGCAVAMTTQSYAKAHPSPRFGAVQTTNIRVGAGASLVYAPQPTMLYADAAFRSSLRVELEANASLLLFDAFCAGRIHYGEGESFRFRSYESDVRVSTQGKLAAANRLRFRPAESDARAPGLFESYTHVGTLYGFGPFAGRGAADALLEAAEGRSGVFAGVSLAARGGLTATVLGTAAWEVHETLLALGDAFVAYASRHAPPSCAPFAWPHDRRT